uniref:Pleckstrin homology domain containing B2 n=1 Tax=Naja naja TaxID=35670 RepID=A0A8C6XC48_NAJNA
MSLLVLLQVRFAYCSLVFIFHDYSICISLGTILRRWKKNWFDLWSDGHLLFYDNQHRHDLEDKVHMKIDCINIRGGNECRGFQPPEGKAKDCLLQIISRDGKVLNLCAESTDDCLAWKIALQDARTNEAYVASEVMYDDNAISSAPPPYTAYATPSPEVHQIKSGWLGSTVYFFMQMYYAPTPNESIACSFLVLSLPFPICLIILTESK